MSTIKRRIVELIENKGLNVSTFFPSIGFSYSNFKGRQLESSPSADILVKIKTKFPEVSIDWLLTGVGQMFVSDMAVVDNINPLVSYLKEKDEKIETLYERIADLKAEAKEYKARYEEVQKRADADDQRHVATPAAAE